MFDSGALSSLIRPCVYYFTRVTLPEIHDFRVWFDYKPTWVEHINLTLTLIGHTISWPNNNRTLTSQSWFLITVISNWDTNANNVIWNYPFICEVHSKHAFCGFVEYNLTYYLRDVATTSEKTPTKVRFRFKFEFRDRIHNLSITHYLDVITVPPKLFKLSRI